MKLKLAQFSTNILFALVMGVFWGTWFALSRSIGLLREQTFLDIGHTTIRNLGVPMSILMPYRWCPRLLSYCWRLNDRKSSHWRWPVFF